MGAETTVVLSTICLGLLCWICFWLFRGTEIDRFRHDMFALRDSLFDEAAQGLIDFDHKAYGTLRMTMNGYIRFAHRLSVWHILYIFLLTRGHGIEELRRRDDSWTKVTRGLSEHQVKRLEEYRIKMDATVVWHFLKLFPECIFVWLALLFVVGFLAIILAGLWLKKRNTKLALRIVQNGFRRRIDRGNEGLNAMALVNGS